MDLGSERENESRAAEGEKKKRGRPFKLKKETLLAAIRDKRWNGNRGLIITSLRIAPRTFDYYVERYPDVKKAYDEEVDKRKSSKVAMAEQVLWDKLRAGDWAAAKFVLATDGGYATTSKLEHTGKDGEKLTFVPFEKVVDDSPISSSDDE